jgi:hypothetical protein
VVFQANCVMCHGDQGQGRFGVALAKAWPVTDPPAYIREVASQGIDGSTMPAWSQSNGGPLTDEEIGDVAAFILTLEPGAAPTPIPASAGPMGATPTLLLLAGSRPWSSSSWSSTSDGHGPSRLDAARLRVGKAGHGPMIPRRHSSVRTLLALAAFSLLAIPSVAAAQAASPVESVQVSLWPEYDRGEVLVIYRAASRWPQPICRPVRLLVPADTPDLTSRFGASGELSTRLQPGGR